MTENTPAEDRPAEWSVWPPPLASRAVRRHCSHMVKAGYCALCGTKVSSRKETPK